MPHLCDTIIWVFITKARKWVLFNQNIRNKLGAGGTAKFKCNCSHCFTPRWMVGLSHYSPSTDMLPRVIWELVKINPNQDGRCHCHIGSVAPGADGAWEQGPPDAKAEKKEDLEKRKQRKSDEHPTSPPTSRPSAVPLRELMVLSPQQVRKQTGGSLLLQEGGEVTNVTIHREENTDSICVTQKKMEKSTHCRNLREVYFQDIFRLRVPPNCLYLFYFYNLFLCW